MQDNSSYQNETTIQNHKELVIAHKIKQHNHDPYRMTFQITLVLKINTINQVKHK